MPLPGTWMVPGGGDPAAVSSRVGGRTASPRDGSSERTSDGCRPSEERDASSSCTSYRTREGTGSTSGTRSSAPGCKLSADEHHAARAGGGVCPSSAPPNERRPPSPRGAALLVCGGASSVRSAAPSQKETAVRETRTSSPWSISWWPGVVTATCRACSRRSVYPRICSTSGQRSSSSTVGERSSKRQPSFCTTSERMCSEAPSATEISSEPSSRSSSIRMWRPVTSSALLRETESRCGEPSLRARADMHGAKQGEKMTAGPRGTETPWKLRGCGGATSAPRARRAEACAL
mmetsp:Transcript_11683/g.37425  ORF Transcript_11683/g.37425 Transcript_11683/m.37425 type:complete len:291 (-) Transcript_11683:444-1316(-)